MTLPSDTPARLLAVRPFLLTGSIAIVAGGVIAALAAHASTRPVMWLVAYLVLVVGVAQIILGAGQAGLLEALPARRWRTQQWWLFNLGSLGVMAGRLLDVRGLVSIGIALFLVAMLRFFLGMRGGKARHGRGWPAWVFHGVLWITTLGALTGLVFSVTGLVR